MVKSDTGTCIYGHSVHQITVLPLPTLFAKKIMSDGDFFVNFNFDPMSLDQPHEHVRFRPSVREQNAKLVSKSKRIDACIIFLCHHKILTTSLIFLLPSPGLHASNSMNTANQSLDCMFITLARQTCAVSLSLVQSLMLRTVFMPLQHPDNKPKLNFNRTLSLAWPSFTGELNL